MRYCLVAISFLFLFTGDAQQPSPSLWHNQQRTLRYRPDGGDFVITNGNRRFTRALYGANTAFRVEAGDLPEFALYMPGMGGNIKFGLTNGKENKWLIHADKITARYRPGSMLYEIEDALLGKAKLHIDVLAMADAEGVLIRIKLEGHLSNSQLIWAFGGATGKKFSRDGDMGPDPESSFYLKPEYCVDNRYALSVDGFVLEYGTAKTVAIQGSIPHRSNTHIADAAQQDSPAALFASGSSKTPLVTGKLDLSPGVAQFFCFAKADTTAQRSITNLPKQFEAAESARRKIADRVKITTPDPYINTIGAALAIAADAIWESPSYLHGAIGWRMRLNGWRGAYAADVLGWHDRARSHFRSYALSQVTTPATGKIIADTALHLARQLEKMGTSLFSSGYISRNPGGEQRPHHYDMNLVFIDQLLWHFRWTGDTAFIHEMWPLIKRHLAWEKRNFDPDNDGLYDAYAAIWASDALQYSGGVATHSSAYNYRANKMAAALAAIVKEDPSPFLAESIRIKNAVDAVLWIKEKGHYAEFKDRMGLALLHPAAALWTIYHSIDSELPDAFKSYQLMKYVDDNIPHIPVQAKGLGDSYYTLSTSNWMPYSWSLNNVALAELMHTSLAGWQAGRNDQSFTLWKSALLESMYLGGSPGNFQQVSTYDAMRGEAYRDFADPVGMTARSLVQGLFGILPDALNNELVIKPGFPADWHHASIKTPDLDFRFERKGMNDRYTITPSLPKSTNLVLLLKAHATAVDRILVNGKVTRWENMETAVGSPMIRIPIPFAHHYEISISWKGAKPVPVSAKQAVAGAAATLGFPGTEVMEWHDPQEITAAHAIQSHTVRVRFAATARKGTAFVKLKQGAVTWWQPVDMDLREPIELDISSLTGDRTSACTLKNNTGKTIDGVLTMGEGEAVFSRRYKLLQGTVTSVLIPADRLIPGTNAIRFLWEGHTAKTELVNWSVSSTIHKKMDQVDLSGFFNDKVTKIFTNQYLSPRPATVTLQLPTQGIGEWTHPLLSASISDSGFRKAAAGTNEFRLPHGIVFQTPADTLRNNILFTSQWDNYPKERTVPLSGNASHAYLLVAGSTNPMQSRMMNGVVIVCYTDGTSDSLRLINPGSWWPIEQDYFEDGFAFHNAKPKPLRVHLKTGLAVLPQAPGKDPYNGKMIDGGAATVLDLALDLRKTLQSLQLKTICNDVVIGLMAVTLAR